VERLWCSEIPSLSLVVYWVIFRNHCVLFLFPLLSLSYFPPFIFLILEI
jgi:hypothetical protein